jgi:hypothetical protein
VSSEEFETRKAAALALSAEQRRKAGAGYEHKCTVHFLSWLVRILAISTRPHSTGTGHLKQNKSGTAAKVESKKNLKALKLAKAKGLVPATAQLAKNKPGLCVCLLFTNTRESCFLILWLKSASSPLNPPPPLSMSSLWYPMFSNFSFIPFDSTWSWFSHQQICLFPFPLIVEEGSLPTPPPKSDTGANADAPPFIIASRATTTLFVLDEFKPSLKLISLLLPNNPQDDIVLSSDMGESSSEITKREPGQWQEVAWTDEGEEIQKFIVNVKTCIFSKHKSETVAG